MQGVYVTPKTDCPHVEQLDLSAIQARFNTNSFHNRSCEVCYHIGENWFCFSCEKVYCSRYVEGHMAEHNATTNHPVALSFSDASVWCYSCDSYIASPALARFTRHFGEIKFGPRFSTATTTSPPMPPMPPIDESEEVDESPTDDAAEDTNAAALFGTQEEEEDGDEDDDQMASYVYTPPRPRIPFTRDELLTGLRTKQFRKIVVLTGAGISVAAGIPDFRSPGTGLYSRLAELGLPFAEAVFHLQFFRSNPYPFYEVAKWFLTLEGQPTKAHRWIRHLHHQQQLLRNFTQNIDGLELVAGLPEDALIQAHGHMRTAHCIDCHRSYSMDSFLEHVQAGQLYRCAPCSAPTTSSPDESSTLSSTYQGLIKPDIVFFGESLPPSFTANAELMAEADLVIVMGTSLKVFPFAMLVDTMFCPETTPLVLINRENPGILRDRFLFLEGDIETNVQALCDDLGVTL